MANMFRCTLVSGGGALILTVICDSVFAGQTITCTDGTTTLTQICPSTSPYTVEFKIPNGGIWTISSGTASTSVTIPSSAELHDIPNGSTITPTDDIQIWLHCANIWDKSYTTITQVLNDASTLQALIASNNAADYMARSSTWVSSVTTDSSAMTYIGLDDYCSAALLADSTWLSAICSSTYFESILNVKVPTMTSNNTPSGEVTSSSNHSTTAAYSAFDKSTPYWMPAVGSSNSWIRYEFDEPVCVNLISYNFQRVGSPGNPSVIFQGSNDGNTWTDISNSITLSGTVQENIPVQNATKYKYYQMLNDSGKLYPSGGNLYHVVELQYYGRS